MKPAKGRGEEAQDDDDEYVSKKEIHSPNSRDGKNNEKANATRSKHSVTEHRRRCKINERFQILRDLIPDSDQKRDTASFLLEVIEYVQYLQEKVQKYEESCQGWSSAPTNLMPWRNSHWRIQSFGHPQAIKNNPVPVSSFNGSFDENNITISPSMCTNSQNPSDSDCGKDPCKTMDQIPELANKSIAMPMPLSVTMPASPHGTNAVPHSLQRPISNTYPSESVTSGEALNQQEQLTVEGGTISITSVYSQGLLNNLTQVLQSAGVDLSHATISVKIDLGKRANRARSSDTSITKDLENDPSSDEQIGHFEDTNNKDGLDHAPKRLKM